MIDHLSPSQISMFSRCGEQYRRRYIEREIIPPGIALIVGGSVHKAAEHNNRQKVESKVDLRVDELRDVAATEFSTRLQIDGWRKESDDDDIGKGKDRAILLTDIYAERIAPTIQPVLVEQAADIPLPDSPVVVKTILDVADANGIVRDLKTASRKKPQADADTNTALSWYSISHRILTGDWPKGMALDVAILTEGGKADYQHLPTTRSEVEINSALAKAWNMIEAIKRGVFIPRTRADGNFLCSRRFCGYAPTCRYCDSKE